MKMEDRLSRAERDNYYRSWWQNIDSALMIWQASKLFHLKILDSLSVSQFSGTKKQLLYSYHWSSYQLHPSCAILERKKTLWAYLKVLEVFSFRQVSE